MSDVGKKGFRKYKDWDEMIEEKTVKAGDCLIWTGGTHSQGYPMVRWDNKMIQVKRKQMENKLGRELAVDERVKSTCNNVRCVNPEHYTMFAKGEDGWYNRHDGYPIEVKRKVKADWDAADGAWGTTQRLMNKYGMNRLTINRIVNRNWD